MRRSVPPGPTYCGNLCGYVCCPFISHVIEPSQFGRATQYGISFGCDILHNLRCPGCPRARAGQRFIREVNYQAAFVVPPLVQ